MAKKTTMYIPEKLLKEAMRVSRATTRTMAVLLGLEELIRRKKREDLLTLKGSGVVKLTLSQLQHMRAR